MAIEWFLKVGNNIHGPMSAAELRQKAAAGLIGPETPIRKGADGRWVRAEKVQGLFSRDDSLPLPASPPPRTLPVPPPQRLPPVPPSPPVALPAQIVNGPTEIAAELATNAPPERVRPWIRYWARCLDTNITVLVMAFTVGVAYPPAAKWNEFLLGMALLFAYCFVEPIFFSMFGTTPGKALLAIDVRTQSGDRLSFGQALKRSFGVWFFGWGMGFPIVPLLTLGTAYDNLKKKKVTTWDRLGNFHVFHRRIGALRGTAATVLVVGLFVLIVALRSMAESVGQRPQQTGKQPAKQVDWEAELADVPVVSKQPVPPAGKQWQPPADAVPVDSTAKQTDPPTAKQPAAMAAPFPSPKDTGPASGKPLDPVALYANSRAAVATILTKDDLGFDDALGSGFFIPRELVGPLWWEKDKEGEPAPRASPGNVLSAYLLTNYHVIRSAASGKAATWQWSSVAH